MPQTAVRNYLDLPVTAAAGVGRVKAALFEKLGVYTLEDLLYHFPRGYQNRGQICLLGEASLLSCACATVLTVGSEPTSVRLKGGRVMSRFTAFDDSGKCIVTFFNQPFVRDIFKLGSAFRFWGKVEKKGRNFWMSCPEYEPYGTGRTLADFKAVYPLTLKLSSTAVSQAVRSVLQSGKDLPDPIPEAIRSAYALPPFQQAMEAIHFPKNYEELDAARRRFIFEELFLFSLGMRQSSKKERLQKGVRLQKADLAPFLSALPYTLTGAQTQALSDVRKDMTSETAMTRLICGDVGSGKTAVAAGAAFLALQNGKQAALMVPTEILAGQHYAYLAPLFEKLGYTTALLTGSLPAAAKRKVRQEIRSGDAQLIIGTQALLTEDTVFSDLALVIADEQHRFGVQQRSLLSEKGSAAHTLVMTATPIPRTLALILYCGLDISYIDELPPGRTPVATYTVDESYRARLNAFIRKQAQQGRQTYVVCPAVETDEEDGEDNGRIVPFGFVRGETQTDLPLHSAVQYSAQLQKELPDLVVGCVHGRMKSKEKDAVMTAFAEGSIQVLVSTTVIEVGVNVPNATLMIVENAERFGLSQLHQLRGRVGRGKYRSYCVLVSDCPDDSVAAERLKTICRTQKGLEIANEDLKLRGPGDFFPSAGEKSTRQSGEFSFRIASSCTDAALPQKAMEAASALLEEDPGLKKEENRPAADRMRKLFSLAEHTMN